MAFQWQLDAFGCPRKGVLILFLILLLAAPSTFAQGAPSEQDRLASAQSALDGHRWEEAATLSQGPLSQLPDLDFLHGIALSRLQKWDEARLAFEAGAHKSPNDSRFPAELAGIAYKQSNFRQAKSFLRAALRLNPGDSYSREFLATIYFLEGNLEAALEYWNPQDQPRLRSVAMDPQPKLKESLQDRAVAFNAPQVLTSDALFLTLARLDNLGIFSSRRVELTTTDSGSYNLTFHFAERNGWGDTKAEGVISLLSGLPYSTVYPEFHNLAHEAVNFTSLTRWDPEKRRASLEVSLPVYGDPSLRLRLYGDARNENWNLTRTFFGSVLPLSDLNMRRVAAGAEFRSVVNGNWSWSAGAEIANRNFRNLPSGASLAEPEFFTGGTSLASWLRADRMLLRVPERRFTIDSYAEARAGRAFAKALGPFATLRGSLRARWLPRATGDDYEVQARVRAGVTAGKTSLDELFQLGLERDNDLWLRGHAGTLDGRKGAAPLGRRYFLSNWELDKNIYGNGFFTLKLGPFLDNGAIADSSGLVGSQRWLWDAGGQCKVRVLGSLTVTLIYGRDLRGGRGVFYGTAPH